MVCVRGCLDAVENGRDTIVGISTKIGVHLGIDKRFSGKRSSSHVLFLASVAHKVGEDDSLA